MTEFVSTERNDGCEAGGEELLTMTESVSSEGNERCEASGEELLTMTETVSSEGNERCEASGEELLTMTESVSIGGNEGCGASGEELFMMTDSICIEGNEGCEAFGGELLPGIPNGVTLAEIVSNLCWRECLVLSRVSRDWYDAIRSRQVYSARVRSNSTESMVLLELGRVRNRSIAIFHKEEKMCYHLPPIPQAGPDVSRRIPLESYQCVALDGKVYHLPPIPQAGPDVSRRIPLESCQCVALDGKVYILGGDNHDGSCSDKVFVLDVAAQRKWELCAPMRSPRSGFGCGVIGGKIYVCGGISSTSDKVDGDMVDGNYVRQLPCDSEVYDPPRNTWSSINPMIELRKHHSIETVGEELLAHGGVLLDRRYFDSAGRRFRTRLRRPRPAHNARFFEIYNPLKDEWRVVMKPYESSHQDVFFGALGKFFSVRKKGHDGSFEIHQIHILQVERTVETHLYSFSFAELVGRDHLYVVDVLPVDDELLAKVSSSSEDEDSIFFLKSIGFSTENKELTWRLLPNPSNLTDAQLYVPFVRYPLQL